MKAFFLRPILRTAALLATAAVAAKGAPASSWAVARDAHFEVYSQEGVENARRALGRLERLRGCFAAHRLPGIALETTGPPVRVIGFGSAAEYNAFRLRPTADAFYSGDETGDTLALPSLEADKLNLAAHEYAHALLHRSGIALPLWLGEGLAEFFSTVHLTGNGCELGGGLPGHVAALQEGGVPVLRDLLTLDKDHFARETRQELTGFYAESWALASVLVSSPEYAPRFSALLANLRAGTPSLTALADVYGKPLESWQHELRKWNGGASTATPVPASEVRGAQTTILTSEESAAMLAELLLVSGQTGRAAAMYHDLAQHDAANAQWHSRLGAIAARRGDKAEALREWKQAMEAGSDDALLCHRFAELASETEIPAAEVRRALERAIALKPGFDDARYELALLESNTGEFAQSLEQLRAMAVPASPRAFHYWYATANALLELDRREEAKAAATKAFEAAAGDTERSRARLLTYLADTDLVARYQTGPDGERQLVTTRVPHGSSGFNPFVEPEDDIQRLQGTLREVQCSGGRLTAFVVNLPDGPATLLVPDPARVLMRDAPAEFTCGGQTPRSVSVEFAARGKVLRGMQFTSR